MRFQPLRRQVAILREPIKAIGSILLAKELVADRGVVYAVGPEVDSVKPGERVLFKQWKLTGRKIDGFELCVVKDEDLLAVIE